MDRARGLTRNEIFACFGNKPKPIAVLNKRCRQLLGVKSRNVLSSEAYFIDHAVNHHPEMSPKEFLKIQATLDAPDEVVEDAKGNSIGFIKEAEGGRRILFLRKDGENLVVYRTLYSSKRKLSSRYKKISLAELQGFSRPRTSLPRYESDRKSSTLEACAARSRQ